MNSLPKNKARYNDVGNFEEEKVISSHQDVSGLIRYVTNTTADI